MLIKQLTTSWPPAVTVGTEQAEPRRHRCRVRKQSQGHLVLTLRKTTTNSEYGLLLVLPDDVLDKALAAIEARKGIRLRQVGELDIS